MDYSITGFLYDLLFVMVLILTASSGWRRGFLSSLMLLIGGVAGIFGAVLVGRLLQGNVPEAAAQAAAVFVGDCLRATPEGADERLGVWLESVLGKLIPGA